MTLLGRVEQTDAAGLRDAYLERHPQASDYLELGDFAFYLLRISEARYVGGFGDMGWLTWDQLV